jgi:Dolichyl-phosphate-mannose-protein mannosyltransferase
MKSIPYLRLVAWGTVAIFLIIGAVVAVAFPIHASDALTFGTWSRLISEHWHFNEPQTGASAYSRPLFYALQGWMWGLIGYSDVSGRLLCGLFSLLLVGALAWAVSARPWGRVAAAVVGLLVVATPVFANQVVATLTDVFVAAFIALTGALLFRPLTRGRLQPLAVGAAATLAVLAKPSAIPALLGLGVAQLVVREPLRRRVLFRIVPLAGGVVLGFLYYIVQAAHLGIGLRSFLEAGVRGPYYSSLADQTRRYEILNAGWFGNTLRSLLMFTLLYAAVRIGGVVHRRAIVAVVPAVALLSWLLPWLANHERAFTVGAFANPSSVAAWLLTTVALAAAVVAPATAVPERAELAQFALWMVGPLVAWMTFATYDDRLLSAAWPGLFGLMALCAVPAIAALTRVRFPIVALAPVAALAVVAAENVYNIDGLQRSGWSQWRRTDAAKQFDHDTTRRIVLPSLSRALDAVRPLMGPTDRLLSPEGAFAFFFPGRVEQTFPIACDNLARVRVFVLTTDEGSKRYMEDFLHVSGEPSFWAACASPHLTQVTSGSEGYAVFRVGR